MGSSKKKDKDRDRSRDEKKKRKRHSRSRSRERDQRSKHKKKSHRREVSRSRSPLSDVSDTSFTNEAYDSTVAPPPPSLSRASPPPPPEVYPSREIRDVRDDPPSTRGRSDVGAGWEDDRREEPKSSDTGGGGQESLSIEETNKLREKLGLKPLQVEGSGDKGTTEGIDRNGRELQPGETRIVEDSHEFIHKPAESIKDKMQVEKMREKIAAQREKRLQKQKMAKVRTLADSDSDEGAAEWVAKNRKINLERQRAEKMAKELAAFDDDFGVGELVEEELTSATQKKYDSAHLRGMKVRHDMKRFGEGTTILTLADQEVLAEGEDMLVNVNLLDDERADKNIENKKGETSQDYEAPDVDEEGKIATGSLLKKYDEELHGAKEESFRLGARGVARREEGAAALGERQKRLRELRLMQTLDSGATRLASEYLTEQEATTFKKVKKKRKKKKGLTADDLLPLPDEGNLGSRNGRHNVDMTEVSTGRKDVGSLKALLEDEDEERVESMDVDGDEDNNDDEEVQAFLDRQRKLRLAARRKPAKPEDITSLLSKRQPEIETKSGTDLSDILGSNPNDTNLTLTHTDEFCRTLGEMPTYGLSGNRKAENMSISATPAVRTSTEERPPTGAWEEVGIEASKADLTDAKSAPILDEEPSACAGAASALQLVIKKGLLDTEPNAKKSNVGLQHLRAVNYCIDDKVGDDDRRRDRFGGASQPFSEKEGYNPHIVLEYPDDEGRKLSSKEAFRYMSHKFHGKGSGKNKTFKRMKKWAEDAAMKKMSSGDTPLQTVERQMEKQRTLGASYLVLSGSKNQEASQEEPRIRK